MILNSLKNKRHWVFDMDGTLTLAQHDFDAIRSELGLPEGKPILESLKALPNSVSTPLYIQLDEIELEIAHQSKPAEGAVQLLEKLISEDANIGILTRNNALNIDVTLRAAGLSQYFLPENLLSRDCIKPKPEPDGILKLLKQWNATPEEGVMVGDSIHDLDAGNAAGTTTVYVDTSEIFPLGKHADICIGNLSTLL